MPSLYIMEKIFVVQLSSKFTKKTMVCFFVWHEREGPLKRWFMIYFWVVWCGIMWFLGGLGVFGGSLQYESI